MSSRVHYRLGYAIHVSNTIKDKSMKRDMDLIREILLRVEQSTNPPSDIDLNIPEHNKVEITYHIGLLYKAGLVEAMDVSSTGGTDYLITGMTWDGHEFLDASRNNDVWTKTKDYIASQGGGMTFDIMKQILTKFLSEQML